MFCPRCGGDNIERLFGGNCKYICKTCGKPLECYDPITESGIENTAILYDLDKAIKLRREFK